MARRYKNKSYGKYKGKSYKGKRKSYGKKPRHGTKTVITKYRW